MKFRDIPKDYKTKVESDEEAFQLAGAVIKGLISPIKFRNKTKKEDSMSYIKKRFKYIQDIKRQKINFLQTDPLVRHWCDISGYSYTRVKDKILNYNKTTNL